MLDSMASFSTDYSAARLAMDYAVAVTDKAMETQEQLATNMIQNMLPVTKGQYIDTYA